MVGQPRLHRGSDAERLVDAAEVVASDVRGHGRARLSLAPLTPEQALAVMLRVKSQDVKRLEEAEKKGCKQIRR